MTTAIDGHIEVDDQGVARIAGSRLRVIDLVLEQRAYGWKPEQLNEQHPHLSMGQIYAALTFYYDRKVELDYEIDRRLSEVDTMREESGESPVAARLRAAGKLR